MILNEPYLERPFMYDSTSNNTSKINIYHQMKEKFDVNDPKVRNTLISVRNSTLPIHIGKFHLNIEAAIGNFIALPLFIISIIWFFINLLSGDGLNFGPLLPLAVSLITMFNLVISGDSEDCFYGDLDPVFKNQVYLKDSNTVKASTGSQFAKFERWLSLIVATVVSKETGKTYSLKVNATDYSIKEPTKIWVTSRLDSYITIIAYKACKENLPLALDVAFDSEVPDSARKYAEKQLAEFCGKVLGNEIISFLEKSKNEKVREETESELLFKKLDAEANTLKQPDNEIIL